MILASTGNGDTTPLLGTGGTVFVICYVFGLLLIGWVGHRAKKENSLADFYLGGRGMGFFVLLLTLYATQYSGNTMLGFVGNAYRGGFYTLGSVTAMMVIIGGYLIFAPRLHRLAHQKHYITTGDYLQDRYQWRPLTVLGVLLGLFALMNYLLTNLLALGKVTVLVSGGSVSFETGVIVLAFIMVAYEWLGGLRSVAWTDVIQGIILLIGIVTVFIGLQVVYGGLPGIEQDLTASRETIWDAPSARQKVTWLSTLLIFFFGISMYPHAIQRIYAAKNESVLRRSLQIMVFMPLVTTLLMVMLGIFGLAVFQGLSKSESDTVTLLMVGELIDHSPAFRILGILLIGAIIAATMSTIDSALLAVSAMVSKDFFHAVRPEATQAQLTIVGKVASAVIMAAVVALTIAFKNQTIWRLMEIKLEILSQVAPAIMLGVHLRRLKTMPVFLGMLAGTLVALVIFFGAVGSPKPLGVHAGVWGLAVNFGVVAVASLIVRPDSLATTASAR